MVVVGLKGNGVGSAYLGQKYNLKYGMVCFY